MKKERLLELAGITEAYDPYTALDDALHNVASALVNIAVKEAKGDKRKVKSNFISLVQDVQEQIRGFAGPMIVGELKENYTGGHRHDQDEYSMWEFVEEQVLSGKAEKDPQRFFAAVHAMIEKRAESQM